MNKVKKTIVSGLIGISLFTPTVLNSVKTAQADKTDSNGYTTYGHAPSWAKKATKIFLMNILKMAKKQ